MLYFSFLVVLAWMIDVDCADEVMSSKKKAKKSDLLPIGQLTLKLLDENVPVEALIKKHFTGATWKVAETLLKTLKQKVNHECEVCNIANLSEIRSIQCDCCLNWYHFSCAGLDKVPSRLYWFCRSCYT